MSASVSGVRYAAVASLTQGDCNDDDMVEIFDYAIFVSQRGAGKTADAIANFNGDGAVGNADFGYIAIPSEPLDTSAPTEEQAAAS